MQANHAVFHRDPVDKRLLVVEKVGVGDPELVGNPVVQGQVEGDSYVGETFVPPILLEIHGQRVVLRYKERGKDNNNRSLQSPSHRKTLERATDLISNIKYLLRQFPTVNTPNINNMTEHPTSWRDSGPTGSHTAAKFSGVALALPSGIQYPIQ